jgi:recombinational DNA repair protein RecR
VEELTKAKQLKEIIISTNTTPDGENTSDILKSTINQLLDKMSATHVSITTLGRGLSTGAEIEYADSDTIKYALGNRK